jgi:Nup93/Nic96
MDWSDLASSDLPSLTDYPPAASNSLHDQLSNGTTDVTATALNALSMNDGIKNLPHVQPTNAAQPNDLPWIPKDRLDDVIRRYDHNLSASMMQQWRDETRQQTASAVDHQLRQCWEKERASFTKEMAKNQSVKKPQGYLGSSPFRSNSSTALATDIKPDPSFIVEHYKVVERMSRQNISATVDQFMQIAMDASYQSKIPMMTAYKSAWQLVANLVTVRNSPVDQAKAILSHLCQQFLVSVTNRVRSASLSGQNTNSSYLNDITALCDVFTRLTMGNSNPWAVCFYCLRCGDVNAALCALDPLQPEEPIRRLLTVLARLQGNAPCLWDSQGAILCYNQNDRQFVDELFVADGNRDKGSTNIHKNAVLTLLAAKAPWSFSFEAMEGFQTIEDYLSGAIWIAVLQTNPVDHLLQVGEVIRKHGSSYFDDPSSGGWAFALPLIATQQYEKALLWLSKSGGQFGLLQATHIGLTLTFAGTNIRDLGQNDSAGNETITSLLVVYSSNIRQEHGSLVALEYLAKIPTKMRACKEVAKLIVATDAVSAIVGTLDTQGIRQGGVADKYFTSNELSSILCEASDLLSASSHDQEKQGRAVMCLMLAERYEDVLSMLNRLIAPANTIDDNRSFWLGQVSLFHTHYINSRTHVMDALERNGKTSAIRTSRLLLDLNLFFDQLRTGNNGPKCLLIAQKTQLLPATESDRKIKESEFHDLDALVQQSMPFLLIGVMEILSGDYSILKRDIHRDSTGVVRKRLKELRESSALLTSFASSLGFPNNQIGILTNLMSIMI